MNRDGLREGAHNIVNEKAREISYEQLKNFTDFENKLGSGGFGNVYKGCYAGVNVAVKVLKETTDIVMEEQFKAEINTMGRASHKNLIKLIGFSIGVKEIALVYEFMENGSLNTILRPNNLDIKWEKLYNIATEIALGLSYLHEHCNPQIIHYDIKPDNVLLDTDFTPKITDFGLAKILHKDGRSKAAQSRFRGTAGYAAPEVDRGNLVTCKSDVYSFGMMMFDFLGSKRNSKGQNSEWLPGQIRDNFEKGQLDKFIIDCGILEKKEKEQAIILSRVALLCCQFKPELRPEMSTVVKMLEGKIQPEKPVNVFPSFGPSSVNTDERPREENFPNGRILDTIVEESGSGPKPRPSSIKLDVKTRSVTLLEALSPRCPPGGEDSVIVYTTSDGHKDRIDDSKELVALLKKKEMKTEERDISKDEVYLEELKTLMGEVAEMEVPLVFLKGRLVGGIDEVRRKIQEREFQALFYEFIPAVV